MLAPSAAAAAAAAVTAACCTATATSSVTVVSEEQPVAAAAAGAAAAKAAVGTPAHGLKTPERRQETSWSVSSTDALARVLPSFPSPTAREKTYHQHFTPQLSQSGQPRSLAQRTKDLLFQHAATYGAGRRAKKILPSQGACMAWDVLFHETIRFKRKCH